MGHERPAPAVAARFDCRSASTGFLRTRATVQTTADLPIFAVGDFRHNGGHADAESRCLRGAAGARPCLDVGRILARQRLKPVCPAEGFLKLLNTGDGRAIGEYHASTFSGRWCWKLKDSIDRGLYGHCSGLTPIPPAIKPAAPEPMRSAWGAAARSAAPFSPTCSPGSMCRRASMSSSVWRRPTMRPLFVARRPAVGQLVDFFASPLDNPYLVGRIAALIAASDIFAIGASRLAALALAAIPVGGRASRNSCSMTCWPAAWKSFAAWMRLPRRRPHH